MKVVVNADDFAWNKSCSQAIIRAFELGIIDTTTMMSTGAFFDESAAIIRKTPYSNKVGIHFDLTEGLPLTDGIKREPLFCSSDGVFHMHVNRYQLLSREQKKIVYDELNAQVKRFVKTGLLVHHADSHHHIHTAPFILPIIKQIIKEYNIPQIRIYRNIGNISNAKKMVKWISNRRLQIEGIAYTDYFGSFMDFLSNEMPRNGKKLEIMCHPDFDQNKVLIDRNAESSYSKPEGDNMLELHQSIRMRLKLDD